LSKLELYLDKIIDHFFHLPTLTIYVIVGLTLLWILYDFNLSWGTGFIRLDSNQGAINLYWLNGCCDLSW
jgi:hypothetical protein